ncbi:MAG: hypothetical protein ACYC06_10025 [Ilumatobacteraceae bacterium]
MTINEKVRHDLYEGPGKVIGPAPAKLLMTAIPSFSWNNVVTKGDIAELKTDIAWLRENNMSIRGDLREIRNEITEIQQEEMVREYRWLLFQLLAVNLLMVTIVLAFVVLT